MTEKAGAVYASRSNEETIMGAFGTPDTSKTETITTAAASAAVTGLLVEKWYRVVCTKDTHVHFHATEDATTSHMFMLAGVPEIFYTGILTRVAVIQNSAAGTVFLTPMMTNDRNA